VSFIIHSCFSTFGPVFLSSLSLCPLGKERETGMEMRHTSSISSQLSLGIEYVRLNRGELSRECTIAHKVIEGESNSYSIESSAAEWFDF
jgi:hypothetical protein